MTLSCAEIHRARPFLGTIVEVHASGAEQPALLKGVELAFGAVRKVHRLMSFHDATSDVSRLNREAANAPVKIHPWTCRVLAAAQKFSAQSNGVFDITIAPLLQRWGYLPGRRLSRIAADWRDIILEPDHFVRFRRPLTIDLGGIAKGFAVDRAIEALRKAGVPQGLVNAGGDLRSFGAAGHKIDIRHPLAPGQAAGSIRLSGHAMATSALYYSRRQKGRHAVSPLINGQTRRPCVDDVSATVIARDCLTADALTKIVLALREAARPVLACYGADALLIERDLAPRFLSLNHAA